MRLKHIKLVGFKSFVDPTKVPFPEQMTCVVGPNGCGKSNVIDAVRWVLGESSAKNLRGDAMTDVIFNGSSSRKPVSQASVELVFDNESGRIQGEFAAFKEISVKRQVTRDGQSNYFLNSSKCRRRDITDLFLGTGLGPRSYAIIEQGMISRLIESKPQELRVFIEEAAGISKYKERRRETENRMGHTRENLERISDVRDELGQQLEKLQRQAAAATRYKELKTSERQLKGELYAIRWLKLEQQRQQLQQQLEQQKTELERWQAEQTGDERGVIERRERAQTLKQTVDDKQQQLFTLSNQITRLEQQLQHQQQLFQQQQQRRQQLHSELEQLQQQAGEDQSEQQLIEEQIEQMTPAAEELEEQLYVLNEQVEDIQQQHDQLQQQQYDRQHQQQQLQQQLQQQQLEQQRLEQRLSYNDEQLQQLQTESLTESLQQAEHEVEQSQQRLQHVHEDYASAATKVEQTAATIDELQQQLTQRQHQRSELEREQHQLSARRDTLMQLLQRQQPQVSDEAEAWLQRHNGRPLRQLLQVQESWQAALERVAAPWLNGYWLDSAPSEPVPEGISVAWPDAARKTSADSAYPRASSVVTGVLQQWPWLDFCALVEDAEDADNVLQQQQDVLIALTPQGHWFSRWSAACETVDDENSVLVMQAEVAQLAAQLEQGQNTLAQSQTALEACQHQLAQAQEKHRTEQQQLQALSTQQATCEQQLNYARQQYQQYQRQQQQAEDQRQQLHQQQQQLREQLDGVEQAVAQIQQQLEALPETDQQRLQESAQRLRDRNQQQQQLQSKKQQLALEKQHLAQQLQQQQKLHQRHQERQQALQDELTALADTADSAEQQAEQREQLQELLQQREQQNEELTEWREQLTQLENELHELSQGSSALRDKIAQVQQQMQSTEIELAKLQERIQSVLQGLADNNSNLKTLLETLPEDAEENRWQQQLDDVQNKIKRLGAINLAAIEEAATQKERKDYLDQQFDDLSSALETLENAIRKIDKETRQRFRQTFDAVNADLQTLFPKVFGGGSARLELTDDDLLETGVAIMAQPPGKKNSTIHLLSGGEKALTALSLVFAIFRLNPAPFCLLDEVDAPLDDANVGRFCRLVSEMSESVQFIYISHNKVAMEMASHLAGVTMQEAGVSRLVAVDVEQAVAMTES